MPYPTANELIAFFDANPTRYKNNPQPDGYNPTPQLSEELATQPLIPNPDAQEQTLLNLTISDLQSLLSSESLGRLSDTWWDNMRIYISPTGTEAPGAIPESRVDAESIVKNAFERANVTEAEKDALIAKLQETEPDPNWQANVPGPSDLRSEWNLGGMSLTFINTSLGR